MPKISKDTITITDYGPVDDGQLNVDDWSINFTTFKVDIDATPMMKGLPGDHCNSPHWGYVFKGRITFRFEDHDEVVEGGDAFYVPGGHIPIAEAGTEYLQFSPSDELQRTSEAIQRNMEAMRG